MRRLFAIAPLLVSACDTGSPLYPIADAPTPAPVAVVVDETAAPAEPDRPAANAERVAQCVPGTGRNAEGSCEVLRTRDGGHVQQVQLPEGVFIMGDVPSRYDADAIRASMKSQWSGQPPRIAASKAFWIDLHEVTRGAYATCVEEGSCTPAKCDEGQDDITTRYSEDVLRMVPQTCVTRAQAQAFCASQSARLPTESEWEYAARGPDGRRFPWGNEIRDEYLGVLSPVSGLVDTSYFGLRGMGSNALEWVAEDFELDVGLRPFLERSFRGDGAFSKAYADVPKVGVAKGGRAGFRSESSEPNALLGFRCAADVDPSQAPLQLPEPVAPVPLVASGAGLEFFGGVAEGVTHTEAKAFCAALRVPWKGETLTGWRLPTFAEVQIAAEVFRGPGPFWAEGSSVRQQAEREKLTPRPDDPWVQSEHAETVPLAARCVRTTG